MSQGRAPSSSTACFDITSLPPPHHTHTDSATPLCRLNVMLVSTEPPADTASHCWGCSGDVPMVKVNADSSFLSKSVAAMLGGAYAMSAHASYIIIIFIIYHIILYYLLFIIIYVIFYFIQSVLRSVFKV